MTRRVQSSRIAEKVDVQATASEPQLSTLTEDTIADIILGGNDTIEQVQAKGEQNLGKICTPSG